MRFDLRRPCAECPFLRKSSYLSAARGQEIAEITISGDKTFTCHKTLRTKAEQHCAGALIMSERRGRPNAMHQVAERLGIYDPSKLHMDADIYDGPEEMSKGHER